MRLNWKPFSCSVKLCYCVSQKQIFAQKLRILITFFLIYVECSSEGLGCGLDIRTHVLNLIRNFPSHESRLNYSSTAFDKRCLN